MVVKVYKHAREYISDYEAVLLEQEALSQLVLYDAYQINQRPELSEGLFGVVKEEDITILHFSNIPSHNLSVYIQDEDQDILAAAMQLADYIAEKQILPEGITGKREVCEPFIEQFRKSVKCTFDERMAMDIMEIRQLNEIKPAEGMTRLALPNEVKFITEWFIQFQIEALAKEIDYESALVKINRLVDNNKLYVFENNQETIVSMATATRRLANGVAISYVYTPEEYRGLGYAPTNIYNISKKYLDEGSEFCTLFVDKKNLLSQRAYEKVGYNTLDDIYEYKLLQA